MGLFSPLLSWWKKWWGLEGPGSAEDLCARLGMKKIRACKHIRGFKEVDQLREGDIPLGYRWHKIPKRGGGTRILHSPNPILKQTQRLLVRKLFKKLKVHPAAKGFRRGESIVTHAKLHVGQAVLVRIDIRDFFPSTSGQRLHTYFRKIGWSWFAANLLVELTTRWTRGRRRLPQGAPTSPILSNLVNYRMDARLAGLAKKSKANYSRYADDIIFSFARDDRRFIRGVIRRIRKILWENGYRMHGKPKLKVMRRHHRQMVTGLVVNEKVQLPRKTRRWLRAVEHHVRTGRPITLTPQKLQGWRAFAKMVGEQAKS